MKEKTCKTVRLSYGIFLSLFTVAVGALFIWQVLEVYLSGTAPSYTGAHPFTRERVVAALSKIDLFFWLWIGCIIAGFVLWEVFPVKEKPSKICPDLQLARLNKRLPSSAPEGMQAEYGYLSEVKMLVFAFKCAAWALFGIACVWGIVYLCIPSNFPNKNVTQEILNLVKNVFPCVFAGLLSICAAGIYEKYSVRKILPVAQKLAKGGKPVKRDFKDLKWYEKVEAVLEDKRVVSGLRIALAVIGVALIIWGALNGNARAVFIKAINICTECVGLG